jgi:hypothetical protein
LIHAGGIKAFYVVFPNFARSILHRKISCFSPPPPKNRFKEAAFCLPQADVSVQAEIFAVLPSASGGQPFP